MPEKNFRVLLRPPYYANNADNSHSDEVDFNLSNLSESVGSVITFTMTGSATSNLTLYNGNQQILFGPYFATPAVTSTTVLFDPLQKNKFTIAYATTANSIVAASQTATILITAPNSSFSMSISSYIDVTSLGISSSLSAQNSNGRYDLTDGSLNYDGTNSTGIYFTSPVSSLTSSPIVTYNDRSFQTNGNYSAYRLRGFGFQHTGTVGKLNVNVSLDNPTNVPWDYYIFSAKSPNFNDASSVNRVINRAEVRDDEDAPVRPTRTKTLQVQLSPGEKAFFRISFGQAPATVAYANGNYIGATLTVQHNAQNIPSPISLRLINGLSGVSYGFI